MSEQKSRLSIEIDSSQAVRDAQAVTKELIAIKTTGDFAAKSVEGTSKSINHFSQEGTKGASSAKILSDQVKSVGNSSKIASDGISKVTQSTAASAASMDSATKAARALASRIAAIATVGAAISKTDAFSGYENRLKLVTANQDELNLAMSDTFRIAQSSRQDWDSVVQVYQRFSENAKTLGIDMKKTAEVTETVAKAVAISGASAASAEAALTQFGQALASGVLRGEELNSVMEQTPGLSKAIAQGMGITIGQLRSVAAEGKITSEVLINALTKSKDSVDELFGKTSMTIGQSMTYLNNEVTKFVGEAGKGSGAANALAGSIKLVGDNLDVVTSGAILAGIGYVTMAIAKQGDAVHMNMAKILAKQTANRAEIASQVAESTATLNTAKAHLANVQATNAEAQAKYGATAAALRYSQAQAAVTVATSAQTAAQARLTTTTLTYQRVAAGAWSLIGGPIGAITLGVTGLAASYMYMSGRAEEATAKIKQQGEAANKTADELKKLEGRDRALVESDLAKAFEAENKKLKELNFTFNAHVIAIQNAHKGNVEITDISNQVRQGIISQEEAIKRLNTLNFIDPQQFKQLKDANFTYDEQRIVVQRNADAQGVLGKQVKLTGNESSNSVGKNIDLANSHYRVAEGANAETKSLSELGKERLKLAQQSTDDIVKANDLWLRSAKANKDGGAYGDFMKDFKTRYKLPVSEALPKEFETIAHKEWLSTKEIAGYREQITKQAQAQAKADREKTKELEKQNKLLANGARLVGVSGNSGKSTGPHLHVQYPMGSNKGGVTAEHLARFQLGGKTLNPNNSNSPYGKVRSDGKKHGGWDFKTPVGTPITTNVAVKNVTTHKGGDAGFYSRVTFADGVVIDLMHQVPGIDQKLKGGASDGKSNSLTLKQQESLELKDAREAESLSNDYRTITEKDAADHQKRMADLRKHGLTKEMEMEKARYEKTKELRALEQTLEIDGWRWVGEEKIKNDAAVNRLRIEASTDFNAKEKAAAIQSIEEKRQFEVEAIRLVQQEKQQAYEQEIAKRRRDIDDRMARTIMGSGEYQAYSLSENKKNEYTDNDEDHNREIVAINKLYADREILQDEHLKRLASAKRLHEDAEYAISVDYKKREDDLLLSQRNAQLNMWAGVLSQSQNTWAQMTQSIKDGAGEQSSAYKIAFAAQQAFSIASTLVATHLAAAQVMADPSALTLAQKTSYATMITGLGYANVGLIAAQTIAGFATGGAIKGAGTGTSDSIPIMASNGEFMIREFAASKLGAQTLDYINKTGELPYHALQEQILLQQGNSRASVQGFSTGGLVGSPQQSSPMIERQRLVAARESNAIARGNDPTVTIQQTITFDTSNGEAKIDTNGQRALAESLNGAMNNWARRESMQGGVLFNAIRRVR